MSLNRGRKLKNFLAAFIICGAFLFIVSANNAFAIHSTSTYEKPFNGTLSATEWNNLLYDGSGNIFGDFVNTWLPAKMNGPLGIATSSPNDSGVQLDVNGYVRATGFIGPMTGLVPAQNVTAGEFGFFGMGGNYTFGVSNPGNVGIGVAVPAYKLDVRGLTANDVISSDIGFNIRQVADPTTAPTGIVSSGGSVDTGAHTYWVTYTTALGETHSSPQSAIITTTAGNNTVTLTIPVSADSRVTGRKIYRTKAGQTQSFQGWYLGSVSNNTATSYVDTITDASLTLYQSYYARLNSTANNITVGGIKSMTVDTNGTFFGTNAGAAITFGGGNTLFGSGAGSSLSSGGSNTFIGHLAGRNVTTNTQNVAVGYSSLGAGVAGTSNVSVGNYSLFSTAGSFNTAMGQGALQWITTGGNNVAFGNTAGFYQADGATQLTNASNSVYIGNNAMGYNNLDNNAVVIGYNAKGVGTNSVVLGNDSITKTILKGSIGIGTTTPEANLDVNGLIKMRTATITADEDVINKGYFDSALALATSSIITQVATSSFWQGSLTSDIWNANSGNIGIGTSNTGGKFHVATAGDVNSLVINNASGNVLIGTTTDITAFGGAKLQVRGGASAVSTWSGRIIAGGNTSVFLMGEIDSRAVLAGHNSSLSAWNALYINPVSTANTYIGNSGSWPTIRDNTTLSVVASNVGIGTTNPTIGKLQVQQTADTVGSGITTVNSTGGISLRLFADSSGARISGSSAEQSNILLNAGGSGNVGIGTTAPNDKFSIGNSGSAPAGSSNTGHNYTSTYLSTDDYALTNYGIVKTLIGSATGSILSLWSGTVNGNIWNGDAGVGNVGIGTTNPVQLLNIVKPGTGVTSQILVQAGDAGAVTTNKAELVLAMRAWDGTTHSSTFSQKLVSGVANGLSIDTGQITNPIILQSTGGNVGIGTSTPQNKLHVYGASGTITGKIESGGNGSTAGLYFKNGTREYFVGNNYSYVDSFEVRDQTVGISRLIINTSGNVGIGTTTPGYKLDVVTTSHTLSRIKGGTSHGTGLIFDSGATNSWGFMNGYVNGGIFHITKGAVGAIPTDSVMGFDTNGNVGIGYNPGSGKLVVNGNVGIGTTVPNDTFSIGNAGSAPAGSSATGHNYTSTYLSTDDYALTNYGVVKTLISSATSGAALWGGSTGGDIWNLNTARNVGIGTTNPVTKFHVGSAPYVGSSISPVALLASSSIGNLNALTLANTGVLAAANTAKVNFIFGTGLMETASFGAFLESASTYKTSLVFNTYGVSNSERMRITGDGNVGIGTTNPVSLLDVNGTSGVSRITLNSGTYLQGGYGGNPNIMYIGSNVATSFLYLTAGAIQMGASTAGSAMIKRGSTNNTTEIIGGTATDAQLFRIYNTYSSSTSYERVDLGWQTNPNVFTFETGKGSGGGTLRNMAFMGGNVGVSTTAPNDTFSIGNAGSAPAGSSATGHNYTSTYLSSDDYALANYGLVKTLIGAATSSSALWGGSVDSNIWSLASGNVGIGATNPIIGKLQIGPGGSGTTLAFNLGAMNTYSSIQSYNSNLALNAIGNNVSIGTTTATSRLLVQGGDNTANYSALNITSNSGTSSLFVRNDGVVGVNNRSQLGTDSARLYVAGSLAPGTTAQETVLRLYRPWQSGVSFAEVVDFSLGKYSAGQIGTQLDIKLANTGVGGGATSGVADVTVMSLLSNGNVGIGTTAPRSLLDVYGANPRLTLAHNVINAGTVGIDFMLNADATTEKKTAIVVTPVGSYSRGNMSFVLDSAADSSNYDYTTDTKLFIKNDGNVGIGTTAPNDTFSIGNAGSAPAGSSATGHNYTSTYLSTDDYALTNYGVVKTLISSATSGAALWGGATGGNIWNLNSAYNVGIGTTTPLEKLSVSGGNIRIENGYTYKVGGTSLLGKTVSDTLTSLWSSGGGFDFINNAGTASLVRIQNGGNIGIGTTAPTAKLEVSSAGGASSGISLKLTSASSYGTIDFNTPSGLLGQFITTGASFSSGAFIGNEVALTNSLATIHLAAYGANGAIRFTTGANLTANERMRITNTGNIGIGTTVPNDTFSIGDSGGNSAPAGSSNTGHNYTNTYLSSDDYALANYGLVKTLIGAATSSSALWGGVTNGAVWNLNSGNVGIGTTTPGALLDVIGTVQALSFNGPLNGPVGANNVTAGVFGENYMGGTYSFGGLPTLLGGGSSNNIYYASTGSHILDAPQLIIRQDDAENTLLNTKIALDIHNDNGGQNTYSTLAFSSREQAGAGNPVALAGISGWKISAGTSNAWSQGGLKLWTKNNGAITEAMTINHLGNVGIGTTNPSYKLNIAGPSSAPPIIFFTDTTDNQSFMLHGRAMGVAGQFGLYDFTDSAYRLLIDTNGNVGIGTTNPGAFKLKVVGDVAITGALLTQTGSDFAEEFKAPVALEPGTVVVMGDEGYKSVKASENSYDKTVVGIVSDNPSIIAGRTDIDNKNPEKVIVAMMGVVKVKVTDSNGRITKGDLLTTSNMKGYAMRAKNSKQGTVIGKALEDLNTKTGEIKVLVNLQ